MDRYVVYRPSPNEDWLVQLEELVEDEWQLYEDEEPREFDSFHEAHDWANAQHPGMNVFVPQGAYVQGMTEEQDVANKALSGKAKEA